jgi:hypothetical protein
MALEISKHSIFVKLQLTVITKGRRLALPALRFFEAFSRSRSSYTPRPAPLAGTQRRTRRSRSWAESHSRHQRWRHVAQLFPTCWAMAGARGTGLHPISLHFTPWIDTLHSGARHHGHSELPQRPPTHPAKVSSPWRPEIRGADRTDPQILTLRTWGVNGKPPQQLVVSKKTVEKHSASQPAVPRLCPLSDAFPSTTRPIGNPFVVRSRSKNSQV